MRKLYIWGTGNDAKELIKNYPLLHVCTESFINVDCKRQGIFYGKRVVSPDALDWKEEIFVIVATRRYYGEISDYLKRKTLEEGKEYVGYDNAYYAWLASFRNIEIIRRVTQLEKSIKEFSRWIPELYKKISMQNDRIVQYIFQGGSTEQAILEACVKTEKHLIELNGGVWLEYYDLQDLAVIMQELLICEDYYFDSKVSNPFIIDGGANIGLAVYYFKQRYPDAQITAFEPSKELADILRRNCERNHWEDVNIVQAALSNENNTEVIFYTQNSCLAGSLEKRNLENVERKEIKEIKVKTVKLSDYIEREVDFVKLDIEGSETKVVREIAGKLEQIAHLFIEYHAGKYEEDNSIGEILNILEKAHFRVNISKSSSSQSASCFRPMTKVGNRISEVIWAKKN